MNQRQQIEHLRTGGVLYWSRKAGVVQWPRTKADWEVLMVLEGACWFPNVWGKPIAPTRKRWRRLRKLIFEGDDFI